MLKKTFQALTISWVCIYVNKYCFSNNPGSEKKDAKWIGVPSVSKTVDLSVLKLKLFKVLFI